MAPYRPLLALFIGLATLTGTCPASAVSLPDMSTPPLHPARAWISGPISDAVRYPVAAPAPLWRRSAADAGEVPSATPIAQVTVALRRPVDRQSDFDAFLADQRTPRRHAPLSPDEVGRRFGAADSDIASVSAWLESQGLTVDAVAANRLHIRVHGPVSAVARAFATPLHYFDATDGVRRIANLTVPTLPAALASAVESVQGLAMTPLRPQFQLATQTPRTASPQFSQCDGSECTNVLFPADFTTIYNLAPVYGAGIQGQGQTIAVVGRARVYNDDILQFQARSGLPGRLPSTLIVPGGVDPGAAQSTCGAPGSSGCTNPSGTLLDQLEATLDVQRASATAPGASVLLLSSASTATTDGVQTAIEYAIGINPVPAHVLSISFGTCEADNDPAVATYLDGLFAQADAEGISVFVSSGDAGAAGCEDHTSAPHGSPRKSPNLLCASGHVTCVGGTGFADDGQQATYWSASNGTGFGSARGYIPEGAWNDPQTEAGTTQLAASGGGVSATVPRPDWQSNIGLPATGGRYTPDVSLAASTREGYLLCFAAFGGGCALSGGSFNFFASGGTSASAPGMAGIAALLNQKTGHPQGGLNPRLYAMAAAPSFAAFHDITPATSGVASCSLGTPSMCNNSTPGENGLSGGLSGYAVANGYDPVTGLGSINVANLLDNWNAEPPVDTPSVNLNQHGITGSWANPATDSQGLLIEVFPDLVAPGTGALFAGWFTYSTDGDGGSRWYTIQGDVSSASPTATLPIYQTTGGTFAGGAATQTREVGSSTLTLTDCSHGTLAYAFNDGTGRQGSIPLTRLLDNITCGQDGDSGVPGASYLWSGSFGAPGADGQGFVFDFNPAMNLLFAAWYTYSPYPQGGAADQRWFTIQAPFTPGVSSLDGLPIYLSTGGRFDASASTTTAPVGTASLRLDGCEAHLLRYAFTAGEFAGFHGVLANHRVGPVPSGCSMP